METNLSDFDSVVRALKLGGDAGLLRERWSESEASFAGEGARFPEPAVIEDACRYARISPEVAEALRAHIPALHDNAALRRLAWHCCCLLKSAPETGAAVPGRWPMLPAALGDVGRLFYVYVLLQNVRKLQAAHHLKGIPAGITVDTLGDIERWMREYRKRHGAWGFDKMDWLAGLLTCRVFQLGRLQFELRTCRFDFHFLRDRFDHRVVALAPDGVKFRADGQFDGAQGIEDAKAWTAQFRLGHKIIRGNPVRPDGWAIPEVVSLPTVEWELALKRGDPTLGVHIPEGEPLSPDSVNDAFENAEAFFSMYFAGHDYKAFECDSWLLDAQHAGHLSPESNIVRFQRRFYLLPAPDASDEQILDRVFHGQFSDADSAPQETTLQRRIVAHMKNGGRWRTSLGVIFPEDLKRGPQFYREAAKGTPWACRD